MNTQEQQRCSWCGDDPLYVAYHDTEWGIPVHDDQHLFELLCLEGQQAGLSWIVVLRKRAHYRKVFKNFNIKKVSRMSDEEIDALLNDAGLIRHKLKLYSIRNNALAALQLQAEFGSLKNYFWGYVNGEPLQGNRHTLQDVPASTEISAALSKDLKKRGFKFIGSTICYAFMQAGGLVNDHVSNCFRYGQNP